MKNTLKISDSTRRSRWGTPNTAGVSIPHELGFDAVGHRIGDVDILKDISLTAESGSVTCLLGPSGSGKTTLLRIAAGMVQQSQGKILLDKKEISGPNTFLPPENRGIGLVFQDYALFPHMSILDNVMFGLAHLKREARLEQAHKMLSRVGLDDRGDAFPHHLSGGEQQRVALARAMAPRPGILLMDEPFSGLDARLRDTMREETLGVLHETRATAIIVTHDPEEALRMGDQIALLHKGRLEQAGTGRQLYFKPKSLFTAGFFSELNYFDGIVENQHVQTPMGPIAIEGVADGTAAIAAIRVNAIAVHDAKDHASSVGEKSTNKKAVGKKATGRILSVHFTGDHDHLRIGLEGADQAVRARVKAASLPIDCLTGGSNVVVEPLIEGSFAFPA